MSGHPLKLWSAIGQWWRGWIAPVHAVGHLQSIEPKAPLWPLKGVLAAGFVAYFLGPWLVAYGARWLGAKQWLNWTFTPVQLQWASLVVTYGVWIGVFSWLVRLYGRGTVAQAMGWPDAANRLRYALMGMVGGALIFGIGVGLNAFFYWAHWSMPDPYAHWLASDRLTLLIISVTLAPLIEELVFRGLLQPCLVTFLKPWGGVLVTAIIFTLLHGDYYHYWPVMVYVVMQALVLGGLQWQSQSIVPSIMAHWFNNVLAFYFLVFPNRPY